MLESPLTVVVGGGGVGKTTIAATLGLAYARQGQETLVMTFDPSLRLKDALGIGDETDAEVRVETETPGTLWASLLDPRATFDRLVHQYAPDEAARRRILDNRFYDHLAGSLAGVLEYMASERLFEVQQAGRFDRIILDTPPTRQALDFLAAPERIVGFLDSGALRIALKPWFDASGQLRPTSRLGPFGRNVEKFFDRMVGLELLRDMAEFFQAFSPLFGGFRQRALDVQALLRSSDTGFVLVSGPGSRRVADSLFFARKLQEHGHHLAAVVVNRVHPLLDDVEPLSDPIAAARDGRQLLAWLGRHDREGLNMLLDLLGGSHPVIALPLLPEEPTGIQALHRMGDLLEERLRSRA